MRRYTKTLCLFWSVSVSAEMEYRANFVLSCLTTLLTLGGALFTVGLLFQNGHTPGGYSWPAALTVLGVYTLLDGLQQSVLAPNRTALTEYVREGTLDFVLLKPIDAGWRLGLGPVDALRGGVAVALGSVILYAVGFALATLTIWFVKLYNITIAMAALLEAGRYPIQAYPAVYRAFFTAVLPVAFMTSVPAAALRGEAGAAWLVGLAAVAAGSLVVSCLFWRFARVRVLRSIPRSRAAALPSGVRIRVPSRLPRHVPAELSFRRVSSCPQDPGRPGGDQADQPPGGGRVGGQRAVRGARDPGADGGAGFQGPRQHPPLAADTARHAAGLVCGGLGRGADRRPGAGGVDGLARTAGNTGRRGAGARSRAVGRRRRFCRRLCRRGRVVA